MRGEIDSAGSAAARAGRRAGTIGARGFVTLGKGGRLAGRAIVTGMGAAAAAVIGAGIVLNKVAKDSLAEARESQKVNAITRQEIRATGRAANVTARDVGRLTATMSKKVGVDDEEIQAGANMVLTFKNVRNEVGKGNKIFNRATRDAVDLAKAGFGSITSQSKVLAKALNDPIKGMSALGRSGVTFTQQQEDRIEKLVEEDKLLRAQKVLLTEVESQVGGVAKAQATWGDKADVTMGNLKEDFGTAIMPALDRLQRWFVIEGGPVVDEWIGKFEDKGIPAIERWAGVLEDKGIPAAKDLIDEARPFAESVLPAIGDGLSATADATKIIAPRLKAIFDAYNELPDWAQKAVIIGAGATSLAGKMGAGRLLFGRGGLGGSIATKASPLPVFVVNNVPGTGGPGGKVGSTAKKLGPGVAAAGPQAVAIAATGYVAYRLAKEMLPGVERSLTQTATGGIKTGSSNWAATHPDSSRADIGGEALWRAGNAGDWTEVLRITRQYDGLLGTTVKSMSQLRGVGNMFAREFGVSLEDANRILGVNLPDSNRRIRSEIRQTVDAQSRLTPVFLGNKAAAGELLDRLGVIAQDWRPRVAIDGLETAQARLDSFQSKLTALGNMGVTPTVNTPRERARGGWTRGTTLVGEHGPELVRLPGSTVVPNHRLRRVDMPDLGGLMEAAADSDSDTAPRPIVRRTLEVAVVMPNGREIGRATVDDIDDRLSYL